MDGSQNLASPTDSTLGITATTAVEPSIFFLSIGPEDTPADASVGWFIQRNTAAGTATAVTPVNLGPGTTASTTTAGENHTAEPTFTADAILWRLGLNTRASHALVLDPEGCLTVPAASNNGAALFGVHASVTAAFSACLHFRE